jgi:hypothetical protein
MSQDNIAEFEQEDRPSRDELFRLLTEEIKDSSDSEKLKGWTPWVILASMLSGLWILGQDLLTMPYSKTACLAVFLLVTASLHLVKSVQRSLEALAEDRTGRASFFFLHSTSSPFNFLVAAGWFAAIGYALLHLAPLAAARRVFLVVGSIYTFMAVSLLLMMVPVVARLPIPMTKRAPRRIPGAVIGAVLAGMQVALLIGLVRSGFAHGLTLAEIRIGTLVALEALGAVFLSKSIDGDSDPRKSLAEIRRDLVLGGASTSEAFHRTRTVLRGMWLSDIVAKDVQALLSFISEARNEHDSALAKIGTLKANLNSHGANRDLDKLILSNMLDTLRAHESRVIDISERYYRLLGSLRLRLYMVTKVSPETGSESQRVFEELQNAQAPVDRLLGRFVAEHDELQHLWNHTYPNEPRNYKLFSQLPKRASLISLWSEAIEVQHRRAASKNSDSTSG